MGLFQLLAEDTGDHLRGHYAALAALLGAGLQDAHATVRAPAARAVAAMASWGAEVTRLLD